MKQKWTKVEDGMPPVGERVLVHVQGEGFKVRTIGLYADGEWLIASLEKNSWEDARPIQGKVLHWMTLPERPRGGN